MTLHLYGYFGAEKDEKKAYSYLQIATEQGDPDASNLMGDLLANRESFLADYTLAHYYFTKPGAVALRETDRETVKMIYRQNLLNKANLIFGGVFLAVTIVFLSIFNKGMFSGSSRLVIGIVDTVLSLIVYGFGILAYRRKKYNNNRWIVAAMYFIWAVYAFILVLV